MVVLIHRSVEVAEITSEAVGTVGDDYLPVFVVENPVHRTLALNALSATAPDSAFASHNHTITSIKPCRAQR